jgi:hypothetical protein
MSSKEKLIRFAFLCIHSNSFNKIASKEDRLLFANLILKTAVDKGSFESLAPFITQVMVIGAQGDFGTEAIQENPKVYAERSLQLMFNYEPKKRFSRDPSEASVALEKITSAIRRFLGGKYAQLVKVYGVDALEDAYTKLLTEKDGFGNPMIYSNAMDLDKSSLTSLAKTMAGKLGSIILGDVKDYVKVQKGRKNIQDSLKPREDFDGDSVDSLLSGKPAQKMIDSIRSMDEIFEKEGPKLLQGAMSTLKVSSVFKADLFMQAARGCATLQTPSKLAPAVREDLMALCMILPFHYGITENSRKPRVMKTLSQFKVDLFGAPDPMGLFPQKDSQKDVVDVVRQLFRDAGSSYVPHAPRSLASYIENAKLDSLAKSVSNFIDQSYLILLNRLLKVELGAVNALSNECVQALAQISDGSELRKLKYKMDPKGIVFDRT